MNYLDLVGKLAFDRSARNKPTGLARDLHTQGGIQMSDNSHNGVAHADATFEPTSRVALADAWRDFIVWASGDKKVLDAYKAASGVKLSTLPLYRRGKEIRGDKSNKDAVLGVIADLGSASSGRIARRTQFISGIERSEILSELKDEGLISIEKMPSTGGRPTIMISALKPAKAT